MARSALPRLDGGSPSMEELDRLGWEAGIAFRAYGTRVGVRVNQADVLERLEPLFPPGWKPARSRVVDRLYSLRVGPNRPSPSSRICWYNLLYANTQRISRTTDLDDLLQVLASDMRLFVAETSETRVFIHAGVVGWRGRAIVLPGKTFSGKSTLVAGLVKAGAIPSFLGRLGYLLEFAFPVARSCAKSFREAPLAGSISVGCTRLWCGDGTTCYRPCGGIGNGRWRARLPLQTLSSLAW